MPGPAGLRNCGSCTVCCTYLPIGELGKAALTPCQNLLQGDQDGYTGSECAGNCTIYDTKPGVCTGYSCMWRYGYGTAEDRPDRSGVLIDNLLPIANALQCKPIRKGAADTPEGEVAISRISRERDEPALVAGFPETRMVRVVGRGAV